MEENKKEITKPEFKQDIKAEIKSIGQIEDNINDVKEYALDLAKYYKNVVFTEETLKDAKTEKAEVNKFKKKVADFRKQVSERWNQPLEQFIKVAKETENILGNTYDSINNQAKHYEDEQKENIKKLCEKFFNEYAVSQEVDFLKFEQMNMNVTLGMVTEKGQLTKKTQEQITLFIDKVLDDVNLINSQEYIDEMIIEYKKDLNVSRAITEVKKRHIELEKVKEENESKKTQELTDEIMLEKINSISAPTEEKVEVQKEIGEMTFKVRGPMSKLIEVKEFLDNGGYDYE